MIGWVKCQGCRVFFFSGKKRPVNQKNHAATPVKATTCIKHRKTRPIWSSIHYCLSLTVWPLSTGPVPLQLDLYKTIPKEESSNKLTKLNKKRFLYHYSIHVYATLDGPYKQGSASLQRVECFNLTFLFSRVQPKTNTLNLRYPFLASPRAKPFKL